MGFWGPSLHIWGDSGKQLRKVRASWVCLGLPGFSGAKGREGCSEHGQQLNPGVR